MQLKFPRAFNFLDRFNQFLIEDIILQKDRRNISVLRPYLQKDFVRKAADFILKQNGKIFIITGFYVNGSIETDGPLGAFSLARALYKLGNEIIFISDKYALPFLNLDLGFPKSVIEFPILNHKESKKFAEDLSKKYNPSAVIAIERCGMTESGLYKNCRGKDISEYTAKLDYLFASNNTIAIGDGGNEIGMGNSRKQIKENLEIEPCITKVKHLIIASVSNWGAYGLVASLGIITGKKLLPEISEIKSWLKMIVDNGAVDGFSEKSEMKVDGFTFEDIENILRKVVKAETN